jgi:hypothetical protein
MRILVAHYVIVMIFVVCILTDVKEDVGDTGMKNEIGRCSQELIQQCDKGLASEKRFVVLG